jgi:hypothetical protein
METSTRMNDIQQIVGRERRERVSQLTWFGEGCFDSRRRVNSTVRRILYGNDDQNFSLFVAYSCHWTFMHGAT